MKKGFTLAEVLITLGIIGVVSALSLPTLIGNYQEKILVTQLQKNYNMIRNNVLNAMQTEGVLRASELVRHSGSGTQNRDKARNFLRQYFEVTKMCTLNDTSGCLAPEYTKLNNSTVTGSQMVTSSIFAAASAVCGVASTGATICVSFGNNGGLSWVIDVNGVNAPNKYGRDVFWFGMDSEARAYLSETYTRHNNSTYDAADAALANRELNGELCTSTNSEDSLRKSTCLAKVIANGWKLD